MLEEHGPVLGIMRAPTFPQVAVELGPDDALLLYTDGLIEHNPRIDDERDLARLLGSLSSASAGALLGELEYAALGNPRLQPRDDVAMLLLRVAPATEVEDPEPAEAAVVPS
jgi:sigma-B regulation protein RsbU (phosphoserine phosphatase)